MRKSFGQGRMITWRDTTLIHKRFCFRNSIADYCVRRFRLWGRWWMRFRRMLMQRTRQLRNWYVSIRKIRSLFDFLPRRFCCSCLLASFRMNFILITKGSSSQSSWTVYFGRIHWYATWSYFIYFLEQIGTSWFTMLDIFSWLVNYGSISVRVLRGGPCQQSFLMDCKIECVKDMNTNRYGLALAVLGMLIIKFIEFIREFCTFFWRE